MELNEADVPEIGVDDVYSCSNVESNSCKSVIQMNTILKIHNSHVQIKVMSYLYSKPIA